MCGTGIGMAMVANKVPGVRAAVYHDPYATECARNNAQIVAFGAQIISTPVTRRLLEIWLIGDLQDGRSTREV